MFSSVGQLHRRLGDVTVLEKPLSGLGAPIAFAAGIPQPQLVPQQVGEEVVVTEPVAVATNRHHEQSPVVQLLERCQRIGAPREPFTEIRIEPWGNRSVEQELPCGGIE